MRKFIVDFDPTFYQGVAAKEASWRRQESLTVAPFTGGAIEVKQGHLQLDRLRAMRRRRALSWK